MRESKQPKIKYMGQELSEEALKELAGEEIREPDAVAMEDYFAPVQLSGAAVDRASQIVPEDRWKPTGIYTWLQGRADLAFKQLPTSAKQIDYGRLRYFFEYTAEGPRLRMVALLPH